jgi:hypothetical protein
MVKRNNRNIFGLFVFWEGKQSKTRNSKLKETQKSEMAEICQNLTAVQKSIFTKILSCSDRKVFN